MYFMIWLNSINVGIKVTFLSAPPITSKFDGPITLVLAFSKPLSSDLTMQVNVDGEY